MDDVLSSCEWALKIDNASGALLQFVNFLHARSGSGAIGAGVQPPLGAWRTEVESTPPSRRAAGSGQVARLSEDSVFVCELADDQFTVRPESKNGPAATAASGFSSTYVPPEIWHALGALPGATLTVNRRAWAFPLRSYAAVLASLHQMGNVEPIPSWVKQLTEKGKRQAGDMVQEARLPPNLLPYQLEGVRFGMSRLGRCLFGDEMGLGKTLQALALADQYREDWPVLVVCPSSLRWVWKEQALQWLSHTVGANDVQVIQKGSEDLQRQAKLWIISYKLLASDFSKGKFQKRPDGTPHGVVIADESHNIKEWNTARTKAVVPLLRGAHRAILLSGTPTRNSADELHPQLCALIPDLHAKVTEFRSRYCAQQQHSIYGGRLVNKVVGARNTAELNQLLTSTVMIRRLKKDVLSQLPDKRRQKVPIEVCDAKLLREIRKESQEESGVTAFGEANNSGMTNIFAKICKAKLPAVKEYILEVLERGDEKAIIFAHHKLMLDEISDLLSKELPKDGRGSSHIRIDGSVPQAKRPELVKRFQEDASCRIALLSITACGEGITMTAAGLVIFAELFWVPGAVEQAEARAHRIGSTHSKVVVEFLVVPNSPDEHIYNSLERKKKDTSLVLDGFSESLNAVASEPSERRKRSAAEGVGVGPPDTSGKRQTKKVKFETPSPVDRSKVEFLLRAVRESRQALEASSQGLPPTTSEAKS
ncbi:unnamed protein product [Polarella glacialis]|uniref:SWI/SNF-related matrix-associated actin-dependent regulator of chromatin subfamily A-like protein 1 n=1 Tax=Polarella glacialis TaxID=89957 RepID=A0A813J156_POLGL|nr:unnamed protein product [Polarella glacialis]